MRQFVVIGHDAPTTPDFSLDDLPGGAGRLDVLCRCVNSAFFLSHALRDEVRVHLVINDEYTVLFEGDALRRLNPDERSTAALIRGALDDREEAIGPRPYETSPGVSIARRNLKSTLETVAEEGTVIQLHEAGVAADAVDPPVDPIFVLSDHHDFTDAERDSIADLADLRIRLGPKALHADHAIVVGHHWLDTGGWVEI